MSMLGQEAERCSSGWRGAPERVRIYAGRYLGVWAADQLGYSGSERLHYAESMACEQDPVQQVRQDLRQRGVAPGSERLEELYRDFLDAACAECGLAQE